MAKNRKAAGADTPHGGLVTSPGAADGSTDTMRATDFITVLAAHAGAYLTKVFKADGKTDSYDDAKSFKFKEVPVSNIAELSAVLAKQEVKHNRCVVRGRFVGEDKAEKSDVEGTFLRQNVNLDEAPHHWVMIDIDKYVVDFGDPVHDPVDTILDFVAQHLPACFMGRSFHWQLSSSAGTKGKENILKAHVWFWLETPYTGAQLTPWVKAKYKLIDTAVFRRAQIHYTANPIFEEGVPDPVPVRSGLYHGPQGDTVPLVLDEAVLEQARTTGSGTGNADAPAVDMEAKEGVIGAYCRAFPVETVLLEHVQDEFEQGSTDRRWTWLNGGGTPEGIWIHDDGNHIGASHHTWPTELGARTNKWDLVRVFKFGHLDVAEDDLDHAAIDHGRIQSRPSHLAMLEWAKSLPGVQEELTKEEQEKRAAELAAVTQLIAEISTAEDPAEVMGCLAAKVKVLKAEGIDKAIAANLDKAIQQRLKALSPVKAAPAIADVRAMTRPDVPEEVGGAPVLDGADHMAIARHLVKAKLVNGQGVRLAIRCDGTWYRFDGRCFIESQEEKVRNETWRFLERALRRGEDGPEEFKPSMDEVRGVVDALKAVLASDLEAPPVWLGGYKGADPKQLVVMNNGIVDTVTGEVLEHTPRLFSTNCLPFYFDDAAQCPAWENFLGQVFPGDTESIQLLQEWFGYCLTADTSQQKFLMIVGPKRSGKGTIGRVLSSLVGARNMIGPTLSSLAERHGLEPWIGKLIAIVGDARSGGREPQTAVERILSITGEDALSVPRMYRQAWDGKLYARLTILSNELLRLGDASGALVGRMLVLQMRKSFYDKEDVRLFEKLEAELPGIFNWALAGKRSLAARGRFTQPKSATDLLDATRNANDPVGTFVAEYCELGAGYEESQAMVFWAWGDWCQREHTHAGTLPILSKNLMASLPGISLHRPRQDGKQVRSYKGIRVLDDVKQRLKVEADFKD